MTEFFSRFTQNAEEVTLKLVEKKVDIELEHERQVTLFPNGTAADKTKNILHQLSEIYTSVYQPWICLRYCPTPGLDLQDEAPV